MSNFRAFFLLLWLFVCGCILLFYLFDPGAWEDSEIVVLFHLRMVIATFPLGYIFYSFLTFIDFSYFCYFGQKLCLVIFWLVFSVLGYVQWFVIVPGMYAVLRRWLLSKTS